MQKGILLMDKIDILKAASDIVEGDRQTDYGSAYENMADIAELWTCYLGVELSPKDVAIMNVLQKVSRLKTSPKKADHYVDMCGYAAIAGEVAGCD
jgi:hypothetical protein